MENAIQTKVTCLVCGSEANASFEKAGYSLYRCPSCKLLFVHPVPATDSVYSKDYFSGAEQGHGYVDYDRDKKPMIPVFEEYVRRIITLRPSRGALLDVGAATGFFVEIARRMGFAARGVELSDYAAQVGRAKGLDIMTGTLADIDGRFDALTMLDVIEHVPDPRTELMRAYALLNPGGVLIINTPDQGSFYAHLMGARWHLIVPPEHLYYFTRKNLSALLEECGFAVVEATTIGKSFTLPYIFKTLYGWQGLGLWRWLESAANRTFLKRISIPINLRDNMFIVAQKPH